MKLATLRSEGSTRAVRVIGQQAIELDSPDVGALLEQDDWRSSAERAAGRRHDLASADLAPVIPRPGKIVCVGLNYRKHILEMGRELPEHPTLFAKFAEALVGPYDDVVLPAITTSLDWEAELAVVIGSAVRSASPAQARQAIAGYAILNDVTARDYQFRTREWLQGKTFEATTPFGPYLVTTDEFEPDAEISCTVDGEVMQQANVADLVFDPVALVEYISRIITLKPGDVIATGTPGGVGHARQPPKYLAHGNKLVTRIGGLGELSNVVRAD